MSRARVTTLYKAIEGHQDLTRYQSELGNTELKRLCVKMASMRIPGDGVLEVGVADPSENKVLCSMSTFYQPNHHLGYPYTDTSRVAGTVHRLQLTWY